MILFLLLHIIIILYIIAFYLTKDKVNEDRINNLFKNLIENKSIVYYKDIIQIKNIKIDIFNKRIIKNNKDITSLISSKTQNLLFVKADELYNDLTDTNKNLFFQ